jgi:uncharacterized protein (DUF1015 family)
MPRLSPFAALRYAEDIGPPADLIAPPYDVIDSSLAVELRHRNPHNAVHLVLPEGEGEERYAKAAEDLAAWRRDGVLIEDPQPAVYAYRQRYQRGGETIERLALFGALELEPPGTGVLLHERTHAGPKADRLALTLATRTQLSSIFLLARDPDATLLEALRALTAGPPRMDAKTPDGIEHALWVIADEGVAAVLCALAGRHPLLIADGHHRYETALEAARQLEGDRARHVLACVVSAEDPGLTIRPTHRTLMDTGDVSVSDLPDRLERWFDVERLEDLHPAGAELAAADDPAAMVMVAGDPPSAAFRLRPKADAEADDPDEADDPEAQLAADAAQRIAAVAFDLYVMGGLLGREADEAAAAGQLEYHRSAAEAVHRSRPGGAAFLLPAVSLADVWDVTTAGLRLPPKSTYFEPKIPSGLLYRPL